MARCRAYATTTEGLCLSVLNIWQERARRPDQFNFSLFRSLLLTALIFFVVNFLSQCLCVAAPPSTQKNKIWLCREDMVRKKGKEGEE